MSESRCRTFKYRLHPTKRQQSALSDLLSKQGELYNAALEARRGAWAWEKRSQSYIDDCRVLTELWTVRPDVLECGVTVCRGTLKRLDRAFSDFYRRCRRGEKPGYPRFRSRSRFDSVQWEDRSGWKLDEARCRLRLLGIGEVKVRLHRPVRGVAKAITVKREGSKWWVSIRCVDVPAEPLPTTGRSVGIDLGVHNLVATSEGKLIPAGRYLRCSKDELGRAQRDLARKHLGSKRRKKAGARLGALHRRITNRRRDELHKLSRGLVNAYDVICYEHLSPKKMSRRPKPKSDGKGGYLKNGARAKSGLNRSIHDASWGTLVAMVSYKAEDAGRALIAVEPRFTSQRCPSCEHVDKMNRNKERFCCVSCGFSGHADLVAATNILRAGRARQLISAAEGRN
ncbi:MAG: transposase [Acidimicrobiales bacterium]